MAHRTKRPDLSTAEERLYLLGKRMKKLKKYQLKNPTHQEIAEQLGITVWAANKTIHNLIDKGYARNPKEQKRSLEFY